MVLQLDLSNNQLWCLGPDDGNAIGTAVGFTAIADALRVNGALTALDLSNIGLCHEGLCAICEAIQSNKETKLASLNMFNNGYIRLEGAKSVAAMVTVTSALTKME
jgi:hypothetical protein